MSKEGGIPLVKLLGLLQQWVANDITVDAYEGEDRGLQIWQTTAEGEHVYVGFVSTVPD